MDFSTIVTDGKLKPKKKSGGFQSMGLSAAVLKAILKRGYKVPTPIQRKAIPVIMEGKNVIAMARTGSGKTAAFLIPMLEKLKGRQLGPEPEIGVRAIIFSPTRELALQTMKFTKELSCKTELKSVLILGGEKMEKQFAAIHDSPDILIATPGRFLHLVMEMQLKLHTVEYLVLDEADRLFEMGFGDKLQSVMNRLRGLRQTVLFSATLPKLVIDFVKSGIEDPVVIRLDVDSQISENLKAAFLCCRNDDKPAVLLHLLKNVVNIKTELTVVFVATKHHIEYLKEVLLKADIPCTFIYSSLDQAARKINLAKFKLRKVGVMLVTDIAARGIDIPLLDNVINYHFPANAKLYVHRVGRVARAGRSGRSFSMFSSDECPYLLDLYLFLGESLKFANSSQNVEDNVIGTVPQSVIDDEADDIQSWQNESSDFAALHKIAGNALQLYIKTRGKPSSESIRRLKEYSFDSSEIHPIFKAVAETTGRSKMLADIKSFRPNTTIFELGALAKTEASAVMRNKRKYHNQVDTNRLHKLILSMNSNNNIADDGVKKYEETMGNKNLQITISDSKPVKEKQEENEGFKDKEHYLSYMVSENFKEKGLGLQSSFIKDVSLATFDLNGDDLESSKHMKNALRWDRKKKKYVREGGNEGKAMRKLKTESGIWITKSYKSNIYDEWVKNNKVKFWRGENTEDAGSKFGKQRIGGGGRWSKHGGTKGGPVVQKGDPGAQKGGKFARRDGKAALCGKGDIKVKKQTDKGNPYTKGSQPVGRGQESYAQRGGKKVGKGKNTQVRNEIRTARDVLQRREAKARLERHLIRRKQARAQKASRRHRR